MSGAADGKGGTYATEVVRGNFEGVLLDLLTQDILKAVIDCKSVLPGNLDGLGVPS